MAPVSRSSAPRDLTQGPIARTLAALLPGRHDLNHYRPRPQLLRAIIVKGVPMGLQMVVISSAALVMMGMVNAYGVRTAVAYGVAAQL